jgi:hypothetical protein
MMIQKKEWPNKSLSQEEEEGEIRRHFIAISSLFIRNFRHSPHGEWYLVNKEFLIRAYWWIWTVSGQRIYWRKDFRSYLIRAEVVESFSTSAFSITFLKCLMMIGVSFRRKWNEWLGHDPWKGIFGIAVW